MNSDRKKELRHAYASRKTIGGVCLYKCGERTVIQATSDIAGLKNRFAFSMSTKTCPLPALQAAWETLGNEACSFEVLEELEKKETQTDREYQADLDILLELWLERYANKEPR